MRALQSQGPDKSPTCGRRARWGTQEGGELNPGPPAEHSYIRRPCARRPDSRRAAPRSGSDGEFGTRGVDLATYVITVAAAATALMAMLTGLLAGARVSRDAPLADRMREHLTHGVAVR